MEKLKETIMMLVKAALDEDVGPGDLTTIACLEPVPVKAVIVAKGDGTHHFSQDYNEHLQAKRRYKKTMEKRGTGEH